MGQIHSDLRKHSQAAFFMSTLSAICPWTRASIRLQHGQPQTPSAQPADLGKSLHRPRCLAGRGEGDAVYRAL